jgi:hypothetical protein
MRVTLRQPSLRRKAGERLQCWLAASMMGRLFWLLAIVIGGSPAPGAAKPAIAEIICCNCDSSFTFALAAEFAGSEANSTPAMSPRVPSLRVKQGYRM